MFALIESHNPKQTGAWTGRALSLMVHAAMVTAALAATRRVTSADPPAITVVTLPPWVSPTRPDGCETCRTPGVVPAPPSVPVPTTLPPNVPTIVPGVPSPDPGLITGPGPGDPLAPSGAPSGPLGVLPAELVDEPPVMLWHPEPRYPEVYRQAGVEGSAVIEAVVDSTGRIEPGSPRVVAASQPLFGAEALAVVLGSRYRPARLDGRPVRARVRVPVRFGIRP